MTASRKEYAHPRYVPTLSNNAANFHPIALSHERLLSKQSPGEIRSLFERSWKAGKVQTPLAMMEQRGRIPVGPPVNNPLPSYWHDTKSPLANVVELLADALNPTQPFDYVIIGSGISGTMIAFNLLETAPDARIVMLEAREICSGATGRNGGHTKAASYRSYMQHVQELGIKEALKIARLEYANIIETHRMAARMGIKCESNLCDTVDVIYHRATFELGRLAIQALRADAAEDEKEVGKMAYYEIYEDMGKLQDEFMTATTNANSTLSEREELAGAFKYLAGRIHAYRFTTDVLQDCVRKGLQLCTNTPVLAIRPSSYTHKDGEALWDVFTQYKTITTKNVIIASNGYTPYLLNELQGAIVPMRGQITAQRPGSGTKLPSPLPTTYSFIYREGYEYMIPQPLPGGGQHIVIGGGLGRLPNAGASEYGTVDDGSMNPEISNNLRSSLPGYFGAENWGETSKDDASSRIVREWTGIMGATADGRPFVGEVPNKKGMWISAGFNGHGMVLCLKSAEALVTMLKTGGETPDWFPESFLITEERLKRCRFSGRTDLQAH